MLAIFLGVVGASVLYVVRTTPEYASEGLLLVENRRYDPSNALTMGYIPAVDGFSAEMQLEILAHSPVIVRNVAERVLAAEFVPDTDLRFSVLDERADLTEAELAARLQGEVLSIDQIGTNTISVRAVTANPSESAFLANAFSEEAVKHSRELSRQRISTSRQFLEQRIGEGRENLQSSEQNLQQYMSREGAIAIDQAVTAAVSNLSRVETALSQAQIELDMERASLGATEAELRRIRPMLTQRVASGIDREIEAAQQRVAALEVRLEQYYQQVPAARAAPELDPRTAPMAKEIGQWQERIQLLSDRYVQELLAAGGIDPTKPESGVAYAASLERQVVAGRIAISGLESKMAELKRQQSTYEARLSVFPKQSVDLANLQRDRQSSEQLFSYLEQRLHEATMAEQSETGSLRVLRQAGVAARPLSPRPERVFPLAAFLGLVLSIGAGFFSNRIDRRIYTPTDVTAQNFHLLGVIPEMKGLIRTEFKGAAFTDYRDRKVATTIVGLTSPLSAPAEAYRQLYARLHSSRLSDGARSVIVTSPESSVGKSTTAINLAVAGAMARRRTLLVDVDLRKPAVEHYLGIPLRLTLQDLLELPDGANATALIAKASATGISNLHAISVREPVGNPIEHLVSPRLQALIAIFKKEFELIIFDAPPLLLTSDATLLASLCDVTIIVAAAGKTDEGALRQIHDELQEADAVDVGVVLNRFDSSNRNYKNTYGYLSQNYGAYYGSMAEQRRLPAKTIVQ